MRVLERVVRELPRGADDGSHGPWLPQVQTTRNAPRGNRRGPGRWITGPGPHARSCSGGRRSGWELERLHVACRSPTGAPARGTRPTRARFSVEERVVDVVAERRAQHRVRLERRRARPRGCAAGPRCRAPPTPRRSGGRCSCSPAAGGLQAALDAVEARRQHGTRTPGTGSPSDRACAARRGSSGRAWPGCGSRPSGCRATRRCRPAPRSPGTSRLYELTVGLAIAVMPGRCSSRPAM